MSKDEQKKSGYTPLYREIMKYKIMKQMERDPKFRERVKEVLKNQENANKK